MNVISKETFSKATGICNIPIPGLASFLMKVMKIKNFNGIISDANGLEGQEFAAHLLNNLGITIQLEEKDLANIPRNGAFIAIANHPYGGIESLAILSTLGKQRPETMFMGNFLIKKNSESGKMHYCC